MVDNHDTLTTQIAVLRERFDRQARDIAEIENDLRTMRGEILTEIKLIRSEAAAREEARNKQELANLRWGIGAIGGFVTLLAGILWAYRQTIFTGP